MLPGKKGVRTRLLLLEKGYFKVFRRLLVKVFKTNILRCSIYADCVYFKKNLTDLGKHYIAGSEEGLW